MIIKSDLIYAIITFYAMKSSNKVIRIFSAQLAIVISALSGIFGLHCEKVTRLWNGALADEIQWKISVLVSEQKLREVSGGCVGYSWDVL